MPDTKPPKHESIRIGILASPSLRNGPRSPLVRMISEYAEYLCAVRKAKLYCVAGAYREIVRAGVLGEYSDLHLAPSGRDGGVVYIASMVIDKQLDEIIYLLDPTDPTSQYPENLALKRECVHMQVPFFSTVASARTWMLLNWAQIHPQCHTLIQNGAVAHPDWFSKELALVAHNAKKTEMLEYCVNHYALLSRFSTRVSTGTTGKLLNGTALHGSEQPEHEDARHMELAQQLKTMHAESECEQWTQPLQSGPKGGDVQIAARVLNGNCKTIVFFEDPHRAHEHDSDIRLLERACRLKGETTVCVHDVRTAKAFAEKAEQVLDQNKNQMPETLHDAFRARYGVELVIMDDRYGGTDHWHHVLKSAGHFIEGILYREAIDRPNYADPVRVALSWGTVIHDIGKFIKHSPQRLADAQERTRALSKHSWPRLSYKDGFGSRLRFVPMVGSMGLTDPRGEAAYNAKYLAGVFQAEWNAPSMTLYVLGDSDIQADGDAHWNELDFAVFTCSPMREKFGEETSTIPAPVYEQIRGAAAEVCGLGLTAEGNPIPVSGYVRNGISYDQLKRVNSLGGSILIAGKDPSRIDPVLAVLRGGLANYLITDAKFAMSCLHRDSKYYISDTPEKTSLSIEMPTKIRVGSGEPEQTPIP